MRHAPRVGAESLPTGGGRGPKGPIAAVMLTPPSNASYRPDDPAFGSGRGRQSPVDTVRFSGFGRWNGLSGYSFEGVATDRGEPGRHRDTFSLLIKDPGGSVVANVNGTLDGGNIQSTQVGR